MTLTWLILHDILDHLIIDSSLVLIESGETFIDKDVESINIIIKLLSYELVALHDPPPLNHLRDRHLRNGMQGPAMLAKETINEIETIIMDLLLSGILYVEWWVNEAVAKIIAQMVLEAVPKLMRGGGVAANQDDDKESAEVGSSKHVMGILQALRPFAIVLQKASDTTCIPKGITESTIHCAKVFKGGGTWAQ